LLIGHCGEVVSVLISVASSLARFH
jgi:hypothetical protein